MRLRLSKVCACARACVWVCGEWCGCGYVCLSLSYPLALYMYLAFIYLLTDRPREPMTYEEEEEKE